jgi:hypothetical protein
MHVCVHARTSCSVYCVCVALYVVTTCAYVRELRVCLHVRARSMSVSVCSSFMPESMRVCACARFTHVYVRSVRSTCFRTRACVYARVCARQRHVCGRDNAAGSSVYLCVCKPSELISSVMYVAIRRGGSRVLHSVCTTHITRNSKLSSTCQLVTVSASCVSPQSSPESRLAVRRDQIVEMAGKAGRCLQVQVTIRKTAETCLYDLKLQCSHQHNLPCVKHTYMH